MEEYYEQQSVLQAELFPSSKPLPGAEALLKGLQARSVEVALATSSHQGNFYLKTDHLKDFMSTFVEERRVLGDDPRIPKGKGKPAPDIYLVALETINKDLEREGKPKIHPRECLVFEDSVPGVEAGRRAGMRVVWCPHTELLAEFKGREPEVLAGQIKTGEQAEGLEEENAVMTEKAEAGWPGRKGDGWGELLMSLEDFDYGKYGMSTR
jgi:pseudouridine-5'-monophosphatase